MKKSLILLLLFANITAYSQVTIRTLDKVNNTADTSKPVSNPQQTALNLKANLSLVSNVNNTSDANKPVSTAQQTALNLKANLASPTFTGTVSGITASMVGLGNVDNTSDANKPVPTAVTTALAGKQPTISGTGFVKASGTTISFDNSTYLSSITSGLVTGALGYTPYNATNPSNYVSLSGLSSTATGLTYTSGTGVFSLTSGYTIPTTSQLGTYLTSSALIPYLTTSTASSTYTTIASPVHTGDIETSTLNAGIIVKSPNGTRFRLTVSNAGDIIATSL